MKQIIINECNLDDKDVNLIKNKARALLIEDDKILIAHYNDVILLPGGTVEDNEKIDDAVIREIEEEIGVKYNISELTPLFNLKHYQKNYPTRDNEVVNRLINTYFYVGNNKGINLENVKITDNEKSGNFYIEFVKIDSLFEMLSEKSNNPRKKYFNREIEEAIKMYKSEN